MLKQSTWTTAVVGQDLTWLAFADRRVTYLPTGDSYRGRVANLVENAARGADDGGEFTIVWDGWSPDDPMPPAPMIAQDAGWLGSNGWVVNRGGDETGWFAFRKHGKTVHLGVVPMMNARRWLWAHTPHAELAHYLGEYADLVGVPWRGEQPGMNGHEWIVRSYPGTGYNDGRGVLSAGDMTVPRWHWKGAPQGVTGCGFDLIDGLYQRELTADERRCKWVHTFDVRAMHCAAMVSGEYAWQLPERVPDAPFDPATAGYWLVDTSELVAIDSAFRGMRDSGVVPMLSTLLGHSEREVWTTTPVMRFLRERGVHLNVLDSYQAPERRMGVRVKPGTGRILRAFGEHMRDAREATYPGSLVGSAIKQTTNKTVGLFAREGGRISRFDWADTTKDTARMNLLRKLVRAGVDPVKYNVDAVWIATDEDRETLGARLGATTEWKIGQFKAGTEENDSIPMGEWTR